MIVIHQLKYLYMKLFKLLFITLSGIFLSYCSDNIDDQFINVPQDSRSNYVIEDDFLTNEKLSENEARFVAETFTSGNLFSTSGRITRSTHNVEVDNILPLLSEKDETLAYAVNFKGGGYNIVSANQKYSPIIGFSEKGSIQQDYRDKNPAFAFWMDFLKEDILCQINKKDSSDSIAIRNRMLWREYEAAAITDRSSANVTTTKNHWYWYNKIRLAAMDGPFTSPNALMSEDLQRFCDIVQTDYENRNNLSSGEVNHLTTANTALKSEYSRAGLSQPPANFWTEYNKGYNEYNIENMVQTVWHQDSPYNILNPIKTSDEGKHQPAGCVTIAVAQMLNFHKHPQTLRRISDMINIETLDVDWTKTNIYSLNDPTLLDIPRLIRFVNQGVFTNNGDNSSSSNIDKAKNFFDLNQYSTHQYNGRYIDKVIEEVKAGRPTYMRGVDNGGEGHAFICDGYRAVKRQLSIELTTTNSTYVGDFASSPYYIYRTSVGSRMVTQEYLGFNWGWGYSNWVIIPSNNPIDFSSFNNDIKILTIQKK